MLNDVSFQREIRFSKPFWTNFLVKCEVSLFQAGEDFEALEGTLVYCWPVCQEGTVRWISSL